VTLVSAVLADARRQFMTSQRDRYNVLTATITATATSLTLTYDLTAQNTAIVAGNVLELDIEQMLVVAVSGQTVTVIRGYQGTTKTAHTAGLTVRISPILFDGDLFTALNHELRDLSTPQAGLFQVPAPYEFTPGGNIGYDLPLPLRSLAHIVDVFAVRYKEPQGLWPRVYHWRFDRNANTSDFPSGMSIELKGSFSSGFIHRVWYKAGFVSVESINDDVEATTGLPAEALDILAMGCAIRAANPREIARDFHERQGDTRRPGEVQIGANLQAPRLLTMKYQTRLSAEASRLIKDYPTLAPSL
jgi:hypothetical protein